MTTIDPTSSFDTTGTVDHFPQVTGTDLQDDVGKEHWLLHDKESNAITATQTRELAHEGATTSVHGIPDTAQLATITSVAASIAAALSGSQPADPDLSAIAALTTTAFGRALLTLTSPAALQSAAGLGSAATHPATDFDTVGAAAAAQAAAAAASQPVDSDLTAIAALTTTAFGRSFLTIADAAAGRTLLGLGTAATSPVTAFDAAGAAAAAQAASQPLDADLTTIAGLTATTDGILQSKASAWTVRTPTQVKADLGLVKGDVGLANVDNTSDANKPLSTAETTALAGKASATLALGGDLTGNLPNPTLAPIGSATGPIGDGTHIPVVTIDAKGRVTGLTSVAVSASGGTWGSITGTLSAQTDLNSALGLKAPLASPTFTGTPTAPDPSSAQGLATKAYVDAVAQGLSVKRSVQAATTANVTLSGEQTLDGVTTSASDVLVKNQSTGSQNGIYTTAAGAWTRRADMDANTEVAGAFVFVEAGTANGATGWVVASAGPFTLGTTAIVWTQFNAGATYSAGTGITLTGTSFALTDTATKLNVSSNLSDVASASTARTNLGLVIGTNVQAWNARLDTFAAATDTGTGAYVRAASATLSGTTTIPTTGLALGGVTSSALGEANLGLATLTNHGLVLAAGAAAFTALALDASTTKYLKSGGSAAGPSWATINVTDIPTAAPIASPTFTGTVTIPSGASITAPVGLVKGDVGLANVDNTSNATERAATATLTNKTLTSPVINTPTGIVATDIASGTFAIGRIPTGTTSSTVPLGGVITAAGPQGDASHTQVLTWNAAGQLTTVTNTAIAIAESAVTGLVTDLGTLTTNIATNTTAIATKQNVLSRTAVKTAATYTAAANELVPADTTSNSITVTLPTAPADRTLVGVRQIIKGGSNTVTISTAGSDVFSRAGGPTTATLTLAGQEQIYQYDSATAIWTPISDGYPLAQIDLRYLGISTAIPESQVTSLVSDLALKAPLASPTFTGTVTIPGGASISGYATLASPTFTGTVVLPAATVTLAMQANLAANSIQGNNTGSAATPIALTVAQTKTLLNYVASDFPTLAPLASPTFTGTLTAATLTATTATTLAVDTLWDAKGDLAIGTGADTAAKLTVATAAGAALVADPNATNKIGWQYPLGVEEAARGATGSLASTFDRGPATEQNSGGVLSSGRLTLVRILLPKGITISTITFWTMTTALAGGQNQWFALFNSSRVQLGVTNDDGATAWNANAAKTLTLATPVVTTYAGLYYLGIMVKVSTTIPSMATAGGGTGNYRNAAPILCGSADSALTNPASCPATAVALTAIGGLPYAEVA